MNKLLIRVKGFTLIELLVVILIIGFLTVSSVVIFNIVRMNARDTVRVGNIATLKRALAIYLNDSPTGYPLSIGQCLAAVANNPGNDLKSANVLLDIPVDPLWPATEPTHVNGVVDEGKTNFCYFYFSNDTTQYRISFFLESNSKAGGAGINFTTQ